MKKMLFCLSLICLMMACQSTEPEMSFAESKFSATQIEEDLLDMSHETAEDQKENPMKAHLQKLKIIKTGNITIEVEDFNLARRKLDSLVNVYQSYAKHFQCCC